MYKDIDRIVPESKDKFFIDTNVWIYICYPTGYRYEWAQEKYDEFLKCSLSAKSKLFISSLVLAEFCNKCLRLEEKSWLDRYQKPECEKKEFRKTVHYVDAKKIISTIVEKQILSICDRVPDFFDSIEVMQMLDPGFKIDYNDLYYLELCRKLDMAFVTHDSDFTMIQTNVLIISANNKVHRSSFC